MKAKNVSANSKAARVDKLARAEQEMTQAKLSAKEAKQDLKRSKKIAKEARKRFKTARKAYKTLLKESGGRGKIALARKATASSRNIRKRPAARRETPVPAALMPQIARKGTKAGKVVTIRKQPGRAPEKVAPEPSKRPTEAQVLLTPGNVPVDILAQNPAPPDVRAPGL